MSWSVDLQLSLGPQTIAVALEGSAPTIALIGPNGAGKTTILRTIAGDIRPLRGTVTIGERRVLDTDQGIDIEPHDRRLGYVPQGFALFPHLSVEQNVGFGLPKGAPVQPLLEMFALQDLAQRRPGGLSGGEAQRVALARALARPAELLLLDEPMAALDVGARRDVRSQLAEILDAQGATTLLVTHDRRDVLALAQVVYVLEGGGIRDHGPPQEVAARAKSQFIEEFFG